MARMLTHLCLPLIALLAADSVAGTKDLVNSSIRASRALQNTDGSYGPADLQPITTARLLQAMGDCHEQYTSQDGPFVRRAVEALLSHQQPDGAFAPEGHPRRVTLTAEALLALNSTATSATYAEAREQARRFLLAQVDNQGLDEDTIELAQRSLNGQGSRLTHLSRYLKSGESLDAGGAWLATVGSRLKASQETMIAELERDGIPALPALVDRLLALIEMNNVEQSLASESDELAPMPRRAFPKNASESLDRIRAAIAFLDAQQTDGKFGMGGHADPGVTGLALSALIRVCDRNGLSRPDYVTQGLDWLASLQKEDGGIYQMGLKNYVTSVSIEALAASGDSRHEAVIRKAAAFLTATQLDEGEGYSAEEDPYYGGFGYGGSEKPDLSNTQMALQALHEAGLSQQDESYAKAIQFLNRCQNRGETGISSVTRRDGTIVTAGSDGGAVYRPGNSKAGDATSADGKVYARSYGSMTYALLKSYLFAGLDPSEPRVLDAVQWISQHFTLEVNPGFEGGPKSAPYQGLYYYYVTLARALAAAGAEQITDQAGTLRDWRQELRDKLFSLQSEEGSWTNQRSSRWMEGSPVLSTAYALLALAETS